MYEDGLFWILSQSMTAGASIRTILSKDEVLWIPVKAPRNSHHELMQGDGVLVKAPLLQKHYKGHCMRMGYL